MAALVLANIGIVAGWWLQQRQHAATPAAGAEPGKIAEAVAAAPPPAAVPAPAAGQGQVAAAPAPQARPATPAHDPEFTHIAPRSQTAPTEPKAPLKEIADLPQAVRNELPAMTFSFHVYSPDPQKRTIIINNRRLREGDEVGTGVDLQEITEDGVILAIPGYRVHVGVLAAW